MTDHTQSNYELHKTALRRQTHGEKVMCRMGNNPNHTIRSQKLLLSG